MGLAFKPNIDDLRESPAEFIVQKLLENSDNEKHLIVEPNIDNHLLYNLIDYKCAAEKADILVFFLVAHNEFLELEVAKEKVILDFCGIKK